METENESRPNNEPPEENHSYLGRLMSKYKSRIRNATLGIYLAAASFGFVATPPEVAYERGPEIRQLEEQYIPEGVVAWTDAVSRINRHADERMPYWTLDLVMDHEKGHIEIERKGGIHDEAKLNREAEVKYNRKLGFSSYHDPNFY